MKKIRVGVFMGGKTMEKEVTFNSGRTICDHIDVSKFEPIPIYQKSNGKLYILPWKFLHRGKTSDFEHRLEKEATEIKWDNLKEKIDFAYLAMHGPYGEDGRLQGFLEVLDIPYLGSGVLAGAIGMDKIVQKDFLEMNSILVPQGTTLSEKEILLISEKDTKQLIKQKNIKFPCIVKPYKAGSSIGISVAIKEKDLYKSIRDAAYVNKFIEPVVVEQYIEGMEFSCIIITNNVTGEFEVLDVTEIVFEEGTFLYEYDQKYMPGRALKFTPARCSEKNIRAIKDICKKVMEVLEFTNIGRIDGILTKQNEIYIIEANTLSGMTPTSFIFEQAATQGISYTGIINHFIETELSHGKLAQKIENQNIQKDENKMKIKKRIAVLFGGTSNEKEVSLDSGRNVAYKLSPEKYEVVPLFVNSKMELHKINLHQLVHNTTKEIELALDKENKVLWNDLPQIANFVFIALHGGQGENGSVQGTLEMLDLPYNGSTVLTSALCMNKYKTNQFLENKGFCAPKNKIISLAQWREEKEKVLSELKNDISFPMIVKPSDDGCSTLVQKAKNSKLLEKFINNVFEIKKEEALVEEFVKGMELTVGVVGNDDPKALPPSNSIANHEILSMEEKFLPGAGENQTPAPLPNETILKIQKTIEGVYKILGCSGYARIDCFYQTEKESPTKKERIVILEINTLPALTPATCLFHQAAEVGIKPMEFIDLIVELGFEKHRKIEMPTKTKPQEKTI